MNQRILHFGFFAASLLFAFCFIFFAHSALASYDYCTQNYQRKCYGNNAYWYDSCGNKGNLIEHCSSNNQCSNGYCQDGGYDYCIQNYSQKCYGNALYWYDSCQNRQSFIKNCVYGCYGANGCEDYQDQYNSYNPYYQNNYPYYFGSQYQYQQYPGCTSRAYKQCVGNSIYWFDSCSHQQELYQTCSYGLTCQYGQCVSQPQYQPTYPTYPSYPTYPVQPTYSAKSYLQCSNNNVYWYDSNGAKSSLSKLCDDDNACTLDSCSSAKCQNTLKCDGSTCATNSADYMKYCGQAETQQGINQNALSVSLLARDNENSQWQKDISVGPNSLTYFMISINSNSDQQINSVFISANIPAKVTSLGNLKVDNIPLSKDIVAGIDVGPLMPRLTKNITFEGKTQSFSDFSKEQAVTMVNFDGQSKSDSIAMNIDPNYAKASVSQSSSKFTDFVKKWYLWIIGLLVFIFLFFIVFRRVSQVE